MYARNVGLADRLVRLVAGALLLPAGLVWLEALDARPIGIVAAVLGAIGLGTAVAGRCPGYAPFGIDTRRASDAPPAGPEVSSR